MQVRNTNYLNKISKQIFTTEGPNPRCHFIVGTIPMWKQSFWYNQVLVTAIYLLIVLGDSPDIVMAGGNTMPGINIDAKTNQKITTIFKLPHRLI